MTKPGFKPRMIEMKVGRSNHFTIRTLFFILMLDKKNKTTTRKKGILCLSDLRHVGNFSVFYVKCVFPELEI
jgi:hypothetical protein